MTVENFRVDLRGVVDLFSRHLYSSPQVYLRELLQNAVDAISARRLLASSSPAAADGPGTDAPAGLITVTTHRSETGRPCLTVTDNGIGLAPDDVSTLLATIGRSSKRDDLGFSRHEFIGQFGVGLLASFLVADALVVHSRAAGQPLVRWSASADGTYVTDIGVAQPDTDFPEVGTSVTLSAQPGSESWLDRRTVAELVEHYGSLLEHDIVVDGRQRERTRAPWDPSGSGPGALVGFAQDQLGFTPFDSIPLLDAASGVQGVAFVLPTAVNPAQRPRHRVYLKRMLLSEQVDNLLPEWAYFVRAVVDTSELRPTASRESLFDDGELERTRQVLGDIIKRWVIRLGSTHRARLSEFLRIHHLGVKSLALYDDELLDLVYRWVPFDTNQGPMAIEQAGRLQQGQQAESLRYVTTEQEFRQVAQVASARHLLVINAGYVYETDLLDRMEQVLGVDILRLQPTDLQTSFIPLDPAAERAAQPLLQIAGHALGPVGCEPRIAGFEPLSMPALYLVDRTVRQEQARLRSRDRVDPLWGQVLDALAPVTSPKPQLVLNHHHPLIRRLIGQAADARSRFAVEALYGQALLEGRHPIRPADQALLTRTMLGLLEAEDAPTDLAPTGEPETPDVTDNTRDRS